MTPRLRAHQTEERHPDDTGDQHLGGGGARLGLVRTSAQRMADSAITTRDSRQATRWYSARTVALRATSRSPTATSSATRPARPAGGVADLGPGAEERAPTLRRRDERVISAARTSHEVHHGGRQGHGEDCRERAGVGHRARAPRSPSAASRRRVGQKRPPQGGAEERRARCGGAPLQPTHATPGGQHGRYRRAPVTPRRSTLESTPAPRRNQRPQARAHPHGADGRELRGGAVI